MWTVTTSTEIMKAVCLENPNLFEVQGKDQNTFGLSTSWKEKSSPIEKFTVQSNTSIKQRWEMSLKTLENQAQQVNLLSAELEDAILHLKAIADSVDLSSRYLTPLKTQRKRVSICEYPSTKIPTIQQKSNGRFILVSRHIDIFKAEREARLIAQMLRRWTQKKRKIPRKES